VHAELISVVVESGKDLGALDRTRQKDGQSGTTHIGSRSAGDRLGTIGVVPGDGQAEERRFSG